MGAFIALLNATIFLESVGLLSVDFAAKLRLKFAKKGGGFM